MFFRDNNLLHVCVVPGCLNRSDRDTHLPFHTLPLKHDLSFGLGTRVVN